MRDDENGRRFKNISLLNHVIVMNIFWILVNFIYSTGLPGRVKIISYTKEKEDLITPFFSYARECFYFTDQNIVLYKHSPVVWGHADYKASSNPELLEEARQVGGNNLPKKYRVTFSKIKTFDYDDSKLQAMLEKKEGDEKILRQGIEALIKHAEKVSLGKRK